MNSIVNFFFQKSSLEEISLHQLEQFVNDFPYCAPAQLLLAKKYQQSDSPLFPEQACKTAVFLTNPHWLNDLLYTEAVQEIAERPDETAAMPAGDIAPAETTMQEQQEELMIAEEGTGVTEPAESEPEEKESEVSGEEFIEELRSEEAAPEPVIPSVKLRSILDNPAAPANSEALIPIEPLHTVDYFASQGIKISADIEGQDRLSIKLRSFTDWLKTMKKIHPEKLESGMDQGAQSAIQHIAEHSNEVKEVVTEAMAEVFARQGLHHKAVEVYRKLSLLNPDKRVYFAAKISKLNDS